MSHSKVLHFKTCDFINTLPSLLVELEPVVFYAFPHSTAYYFLIFVLWNHSLSSSE